VFRDATWLAEEGAVAEQPGLIGREFTIEVAAGQTIVVEKTVAIATSRDRAVSDPGAAAVAWLGGRRLL
jgi:trehalose/maltose hydrolase-like predicted phosphorylase